MDKQLYVLDEQSYYLMPLMTGVVPEALRPTIGVELAPPSVATRRSVASVGTRPRASRESRRRTAPSC